MNATLLVINECIGRLVQLIPSDHNLLIVSDHGMIRYDQQIRIATNDSLFTIRVDSASHFFLECKPNQTQATVDYLRATYQNISVYRKDEIPERWHFGNNEYVTDVIIVADIGFELLAGNESAGNSIGGHGYDNRYEQMRPTFVARGPDIRKNITVNASTWHNIDVYLLVSTILGISPSPNNGSAANVRNVFADTTSGSSSIHNFEHIHLLASYVLVLTLLYFSF